MPPDSTDLGKIEFSKSKDFEQDMKHDHHTSVHSRRQSHLDPADDTPFLNIINGKGDFCSQDSRDIDVFMTKHKLGVPSGKYTVVAILGCQSTGKSE